MTYRLLDAGKAMGNCYKMQVFENLYLTFPQAQAPEVSKLQLQLVSMSFFSIIALLIPELQALLVFEVGCSCCLFLPTI